MESKKMTINEIRLERIFDAEVELLWNAWTDPSILKRWFGSDPNGTVEEIEMDLRVGGSYKITFKDSDQSVHTCKGKFLSIAVHNILKYSWEWESEPGHISELTVSFHALGEKSKIVLEHKNLNPASRHAYAQGWNGGLDKIERVLIQITNHKKQML
ncbi:MAG TPA: SRPBCC domain-containing protein [Chitinophagaceae bacterium]|nr:SRPBCC domain-containing protein [Chitinophagaceae bacterium]